MTEPGAENQPPKTEAAHAGRPRRPDIDRLRAVAVWLLVPFHGALIFAFTEGYHLNTHDAYEPLRYFAGLVGQWHMPLLFVLSGVSTGFALRRRSAGQYAAERAKRLLIPLVFGTLVVIPPQVYVQRLHEGAFEGSYLAFYPHFFDGLYPSGNFTYNHLWFILYLYVFSMLALPLFVWLRGEAGSTVLGGVAAFCRRRGWLLLLCLPMGVTESLLRPIYPGLQTLVTDWANFAAYV